MKSDGFKQSIRKAIPKELREMLAAAYPLIVIHLAVTGMQFVDAWMVACLGEEALAALLPAGIAFFVVLSFGLGFLSGLNTFVSQCLGKNWKGGCGHYALQAHLMGFVYGLLLLALWPAARMIFILLGHNPNVQELEVAYFQITLVSAAPALLVASLANFFIGIHRSKVLMFAAVGAMVLNALFNYLLIFGRLGLPALGLAGAAWGTVLANFLQAGFLLWIYWSRRVRMEFGTAIWRVDFSAMRRIFRIGLPAGIQTIFDTFSWGVVLTYMIGLFGTVHLAATTIAVRLMHLAFMPPLGLGMALTAFVGRSVGEGDLGRAQRQVSLAFKVNLAYMVAVGLVFVFFRGPLMGLFTEHAEIVRLGGRMLICAAVFQVFDAMAITYIHALRGAGDTLWPAVLVIAAALVFMLGGGLVMVRCFPGLESLGPWMMVVAFIWAVGLCMWLRWHLGSWRKIDIFRKKGPPAMTLSVPQQEISR